MQVVAAMVDMSTRDKEIPAAAGTTVLKFARMYKQNHIAFWCGLAGAVQKRRQASEQPEYLQYTNLHIVYCLFSIIL
jgi:hypothetical protein